MAVFDTYLGSLGLKMEQVSEVSIHNRLVINMLKQV